MDMDEAARRQAIREENRKLRYLRFMVDLALREIRSGSFTLPQAAQVVPEPPPSGLDAVPRQRDGLRPRSTAPGCSGPSRKPFSFIDKGRHYDSPPICVDNFGNAPAVGVFRVGPGPASPGPANKLPAKQTPAKCGPDHTILYKRAVKLLDNAEKKLTAGYTAEAKSQVKEANSLFTILQKECGPQQAERALTDQEIQQEAINQKLAADELAQADRLIKSAEEKQQKAVKIETTQPDLYTKVTAARPKRNSNRPTSAASNRKFTPSATSKWSSVFWASDLPAQAA